MTWRTRDETDELVNSLVSISDTCSTFDFANHENIKREYATRAGGHLVGGKFVDAVAAVCDSCYRQGSAVDAPCHKCQGASNDPRSKREACSGSAGDASGGLA